MPKVCILFLFFCLSFTSVAQEISSTNYKQPKKQPYVFLKNRPTGKMVELGRMLFFDRRLSGENNMSCADCHNPDKYWSDGRKTGVGHMGKVLKRSTPTLVNAAYNKRQFWDGRAHSLEQQSTMPIESPEEMNQNLDELVSELSQLVGYKHLFNDVFKGEGITKSNIARAIAAFQRSLISNNSDFDKWINGNKNAISEAAKRGFTLFEGKAQCVLCHKGFNFTDDEFHNTGLPKHLQKDIGRFAISNKAEDMGAFKTPTLRNIVHTAPFMHNGQYKTLEDVIGHYNVGGFTEHNKDPNIRPLHLTPEEIADLIAFLQTLSEKVLVDVPEIFPN